MSTGEDLNVQDLFGTSKYGNDGGNNYFKWFKLKEGNNIYRVLPPFKSLRPSGKYAFFHRVHYGYQGVNPKEPAKTKAKPFKCPQEKDFRTGMIKVPCPECDKIASQEALYEERKKAMEAELDEEGKRIHSDEDIKEHLKPLYDWLDAHNGDNKWYLNAFNEAQELGVLLIPHKSKQSLEREIKRLAEEDGIADPLFPNEGVWFNFHRTGTGNQTEHVVNVVMETAVVEGKRVKSIKPAPISADMLRRIATTSPDLSGAEVVRILTIEQIRDLVDGSGDPEEVDRIMMRNQPSTEQSRKPAPRAPEKKPEPQKPVEKKAEPAPQKFDFTKLDPQKAAASATTPTPEDDEEAALEKALAEARARKAAKAASAAPPPEAKPQTASKPEEKPAPAKSAPKLSKEELDQMDPDKFLELFGDPSKPAA